MHVVANGIRIHYTVDGAGPWLVMSHSLGCDLHMWDRETEALAGRFRVLRFDTRGHGETEAPAAAYTLDQLADDLQAMLDALEVNRCHFMGLSMGGMIAMTHALKYPGRFDRLLLCNTSSRVGADAAPVWRQRIETVRAGGMEPIVQPTLSRWFTEPFRLARPDVMATVAGMIRATPPEGYIGCCHAIPLIDLTARLGMIGSPTLVIAGDQDVGTPVEMARAIQLGIPGAQLAVLPRAAHLSNLEHPEAFGRLVADFLGAGDPPR